MKLLERLAMRKKLVDTFRLFSDFLPQIHAITDEYTVFTIPNGMNPKLLNDHLYAFQQVFGGGIKLEGDHKRFTLTFKRANLPQSIPYNFEKINEIIERDSLLMPIVAGVDLAGHMRLYDATNNPNLLIFGEPGSGKSSILHSILITLIQRFSADQLHLYLADFKMSELNVYEGVTHAKQVAYTPDELAPALLYLKAELTQRGRLLKRHKVRHVNKLPDDKRPARIMLCIDEFVMIRDDDIMADLLQVASLGRAYGIYVILAMQRPSHKILSTDVRGVLSARMGFRTVDARNAAMGETPGSELIRKDAPGTFLLNLDELVELKAPYIDEAGVEAILERYRGKPVEEPPFEQIETAPQILTEKDVFDDVN